MSHSNGIPFGLCHQKMKCSHCPEESNGVDRILLAALVVEQNTKYFLTPESFSIFPTNFFAPKPSLGPPKAPKLIGHSLTA